MSKMRHRDVVIHGNCVDELKKIENETIDLIYLDPPFYTKKRHQLKTRDDSKAYEFSDEWDSLSDYLSMIRECLVEFKRILKATGSIFFHCDKSASHHIRVLLDEIFGEENFRSEIVWYYKRWSNAKKGLLNSHQNIYLYSKTKAFKFNPILTDYSPTTNVDQILQRRVRDRRNKTVYATDENGEVVINGAKKGVPLADVWEIPFLNPKARERIGYPTQKPILLLEKIINLVTDEGDLVLDSFCGSGTTLVAAKLLNRRYIGIDILKEAIELSEKRLSESVKTTSFLLERGIDYYRQKPETEMAILKSLGATPVYRNRGIDGFLKETFNGKPIPIRIQKHKESLTVAKDKLTYATRKRNCDFMVLIRTSSITQEPIDIQQDFEPNILVMDSYDFIIKRELDKPVLDKYKATRSAQTKQSRIA